MSKLLIDEPPLVFQSALARLVGVESAVILQQVHFLSQHTKFGHIEVEKGGTHTCWARLTQNEWLDPEIGRLTFLKRGALGRYLRALEERGLIRSRQFGLKRGDATKSYTINHRALHAATGSDAPPDGPLPDGPAADPSSQNDTMPPPGPAPNPAEPDLFQGRESSPEDPCSQNGNMACSQNGKTGGHVLKMTLSTWCQKRNMPMFRKTHHLP